MHQDVLGGHHHVGGAWQHPRDRHAGHGHEVPQPRAFRAADGGSVTCPSIVASDRFDI